MTGKLLGAALIGAAAVWGFAARQRQLRQRRELVSSLQQALGHMASAIRCQRQPMTPLLTELARRQICGGYFAAILREVESRIPLQTAWKQAFAELPDGETAEILLAVELTGDETHLQAGLEYAQLRLRQLGEQREQEDRRDRRLTGAALFSAAGLLVILLI